jgi:hypothetical protein
MSVQSQVVLNSYVHHSAWASSEKAKLSVGIDLVRLPFKAYDILASSDASAHAGMDVGKKMPIDG